MPMKSDHAHSVHLVASDYSNHTRHSHILSYFTFLQERELKVYEN